MSKLEPEFVERIATTISSLPTSDYYQLLKIPIDSEPSKIRAAYHREASFFHPDRYHHLGLPELIEDLTMIHKRITEAYVVLRDDQKRGRYRQMITGPERRAHLRYSEEEEKEQKAERQAELGATPQGRKMYAQAHKAWVDGDKQEAVRNLRMAMVYERDNQQFKQVLLRWSEEL